MNTLGKILVGLNFLFAVAVGAFLVVDFATRTNWKTEYFKLKDSLTVLAADRQQYAQDTMDQRNATKLAALENEKLRNDLADQDARNKKDLFDAEQKVQEAQNHAKAADFSLQKATGDVARLKTSEATLKEIIAKREQAILSQQELIKKYRNDAVAADTLVKQLTDRNKELLERLTKAEVMLARKSATGGNADLPRIEMRGDANPPNGLVKGKVEKVDPRDSSLVQISVGTDVGVNKDNTMEVFRTSPAPKYLGMIRIVDASPHRAVGRLIVPAGVSRPQLQEGDLVWSRLR